MRATGRQRWAWLLLLLGFLPAALQDSSEVEPAAEPGKSARPSAAAIASHAANAKARVEAGEGVPFFDERFGCREDGGPWSAYRELVDYARLRIFDPDEGPALAQQLSDALAERTANLTEVLQCNVGVIAGYHLLARRHVAIGDDWKAYRLLQLALIYVFTLRNAVQVPKEAGRDWATGADRIIQEIKLLKARVGQEQARRLARLPEVPQSLRLPGLRVAVVSICAYPKDHPLVLRVLTPENRRKYAERHGYELHVHMTHPMPGQDVHIQHAKLQLVANYLREGTYDWVAWLDCDSILMNLDKTLDSIITRYARHGVRGREGFSKVARTQDSQPSTAAAVSAGPEAPRDATPEVHDEPLHDEVLEAYVSHVGSCNTDHGCRGRATLRVNRALRYKATVTTALVDMEETSEKLAAVMVGGRLMGECNPTPESDYDCRLYNCFERIEVPPEAVASGTVELEVHSVRTHSDCRCNRLHGTCYSAALAAFEEAAEGEKTTDPSYGMFVKFTLTPILEEASAEGRIPYFESVEEVATRSPETCSCKPAPAGVCPAPSRTWPSAQVARSKTRPPAPVRRLHAECDGPDVLLGISVSLEMCLDLCREVSGCEFVSYGFGRKRGRCYWEVGDCLSFEQDTYTVYDVRPANAEHTEGELDCSYACRSAAVSPVLPSPMRGAAEEHTTADDGVDLLITEEGWGLSSANWLIRRSAWSIAFLERAFDLCHRELPLFGDQDAMIHLLLNPLSLEDTFHGDPLDAHAVIVPQRELNAYDALNAHYMGCDGYRQGDLLVTFPGCKDPEACNPLFRLAAKHAGGPPPDDDEPRSLAHLRLFGPSDVAASIYEAARRSRLDD